MIFKKKYSEMQKSIDKASGKVCCQAVQKLLAKLFTKVSKSFVRKMAGQLGAALLILNGIPTSFRKNQT